MRRYPTKLNPNTIVHDPLSFYIRNYINDLINECNVDIKSVPVLPTSPQIPQWEHINAKIDTDYTDLKKS